MKTFAPVVLFTYKRLPILKRSVDSLLSNKECKFTDLIIYSDGPKTGNDISGLEEVRSYLKTLQGFKSIKYIFREKNLGLAESFIQGITETLAQHEMAVFLEDDNFLSPYFLSFMNKSLDYYKDNEKVICVSGFSHPIKNEQSEPYFLRGAETWSMGTWRRGWKYFCADAKKLSAEIQNRGLSKQFEEDGFGFSQTLQNHIRGRVNSWGVRWWASAFINDKYCLYPHLPLCVNIGFGDDSVHNAIYSPAMRKPSDLSKNPINALPDIVAEKKEVSTEIKRMNKALPYQKFITQIQRFPYRVKDKIIYEYKKKLTDKNPYGGTFHDTRHQDTNPTAEKILNILLNFFTVRSAVDVGCGVGTFLATLKEKGISDILGIDGDWVKRELLVIPQDKFEPIDLRRLPKHNRKFDLAISLEVAEHLPKENEEEFISRLCELSDLVLFSAAIPRQGGAAHVNEAWQSHWAKLFSKHDYVPLDMIRPKIWSDSSIYFWYRQNILVYVKRGIFEIEKRQLPFLLDVVHPELFLERTPNPERLKNRAPLPKRILRRIRRVIKEILNIK